MADKEFITGVKIHPLNIKYLNPQNNWSIYICRTKNKQMSEYGKPYYDELYDFGSEKEWEVNVIGVLPTLLMNNEYIVDGYIEYNSKYNSYSLSVMNIRDEAKNTPESQRRFLENITSTTLTDEILKSYPNFINMIVNDEPIDTDLIRGVGEYRLSQIRDKVIENYVVMDIVEIFHGEVTITQIMSIVKGFSSPIEAKMKIEENPYVITKIKGIGFKKADKIVLKLKPELKVSLERANAFVHYYLEDMGDSEGHTWEHISTMIELGREYVRESMLFVKEIVEGKHFKDEYFIFNNKIGLKYLYNMESEVLYHLERVDQSKNSIKPIDNELMEKYIDEIEEEQGFEFTKMQRDTIRTINDEKIGVVLVTGLAGSGKSSVINGCIKLVEKIANYYGEYYSIDQCALSAKASRRMYEVTQRPALTIHKTLGWMDGDFSHNEEVPLITDLIIADEFSMNNIYISNSLFKAIPSSAKLFIVFDNAQLSSIGSGSIAHDLLENGHFKKFFYSEVHRQAQKSGILVGANVVRKGEYPISNPSPKIVMGELKDMTYFFREDKDDMHKLALKLYVNAVEKYGVDDVILIVPRKDTVINSVEIFNKDIQNLVNPNGKSMLLNSGYEFRVGDKVMHKVNNKDKNVINGEVGYVTDIGDMVFPDGKMDRFVKVNYGIDLYELSKNGVEKIKEVIYKPIEMSEVVLSYAGTTHSWQGSQSKVVIGVLDSSHFNLLDNTMLYTLMTRAMEKCALITDLFAFKKSVKTNKTIKRQTFLEEILVGNLESNKVFDLNNYTNQKENNKYSEWDRY